MPSLTEGRLWGVLRERLSHLLFPPHCTSCGRRLGPRQPAGAPRLHFCEACSRRLVADEADCCQVCGAHWPRSGIGAKAGPAPCRYCRGIRFPVKACVALGNYGDQLQRLVVQMKGNRNEVLALQLGQLLGRRLSACPWVGDLDAVVPVPVHWSKQLQKGFHGAAVIAEGIGRELGIQCLHRAVSSTRRTAKQGMLEAPERFRNVAGAFAPGVGSIVEQKNLLIVDDVLTSGATLTAVATALQTAGATTLYAAVLARGIRSAV